MNRLALLLCVACLVPTASAQPVQASGAWARATVQGQHSSGAFMTLTSADGARLVGAASEVAGVVEIHEMAMEGNVMRMRAVAGVELPPRRAVALGPGGYHVMLMDLKRPLKAGEKIRVELQLQLRDQRLVTQPVEVEVRSTAPAGAAGARPNTHQAHKH